MMKRLGLVLAFMLAPTVVWSQDSVRIATYNIYFLNADIPEGRAENLRAVIAEMGADVIGMQEIADRAALRRVFPAADGWQLVIDDDSTDAQDLAVAVRQPLMVVGANGALDMDADDDDFAYPDDSRSNDYAFPNNRDLLTVEVETEAGGRFWVLVHHAKSRRGGRGRTENRRVEAARRIIRYAERNLHEQMYVLLMDANDTPDDRSLNIMETGDHDAPGGREMIAGPFLCNLTEPLWHAGGTTLGHSLLDQILIPCEHAAETYVEDSITIFKESVTTRGGHPGSDNGTRASDHVPVYADFVFTSSADGHAEPVRADVQIVGLLPNPRGEDEGNEAIRIRNLSSGPLSLEGWVLRDRAENEYRLSGTVGAQATREIVMEDFAMPLNNAGDDIRLIDGNGDVQDECSYSEEQVRRGLWIDTHPY